MRLCCELCDNVATNTYKDWLEHLASENHQKCTQQSVWQWEEECNRRSLVVTGMPNGRGEFREIGLPLITVAWHFSKYGIVSNMFVHPNQKFFIIQLEKRDLAHKALTADSCVIQGISVTLRPKTDLSPEDWFTLSSCPSNNHVEEAHDDLLEARHLWYSEQMQNLSSDMQLEKFISLATMSADDFNQREKIRSDLSFLIKREYGNAKIQGVGDVITGLGDSESTLIVHIDVLGASRNPLQHKHDDWYSTTSFVDAIHRMMMAAASNSPEIFCQDVVLCKDDSSPYITLTAYPSNVNVELQLGSVIPVYSSKLIQFLISLDPRVLPLMLVIRYWTAYNVQPLNSISNYALELLIVTFLNNCKILPNVAFLQSKTTNKIPLVDSFWNVNFCSDYHEITNILIHSGKAPVEYSETTRKPTASSILLLARNFFQMYATADFKNNIVCSLLGNLLPKDGFYPDNTNVTLPLLLEPYKNWALLKNSGLDIQSPMCVQDPFNLGKNVASNVTETSLQKFQIACYNSIEAFERLAEDAKGVIPNFMYFATLKKDNNAKGAPSNESQNQSRHNGVLGKRAWYQSQASAAANSRDIEDIQIVKFVPESGTPINNRFCAEPKFEKRVIDNHNKPRPLLQLPKMNMSAPNSFREEPIFEKRHIDNYNTPKPLLSLLKMNMSAPNSFREEPIFEKQHIDNYNTPKPLMSFSKSNNMPTHNRFRDEPESLYEKRPINNNNNYTMDKPSPIRAPNRAPPERILRNPGDHTSLETTKPQISRRFTPEFTVTREVPTTVSRSQKYNVGRQSLPINLTPASLHHNNRSPNPTFMGEHQQEDRLFERVSRNRSANMVEREPFIIERQEDDVRDSPNHSAGEKSKASRKRAARRSRNRKGPKQVVEEAIPVDGLETYEMRIRHVVAPNFAHCFNFIFSNVASEVEIEQKCTSLWALFLRDYFTEIWETAFKLTAKICDPTIIVDRLYENRPNLTIRDSYSEKELRRLHQIKDRRHAKSMTTEHIRQYGAVDDDDDAESKDLISSICNRPQNGHIMDFHPHQEKFARLNYHEKFCISFLVGGCTEIFTTLALRHEARRDTRGLMGNISPLEKEGLVNQLMLERMRQKQSYREFLATAKVDLTKEPPELLTIFTETPDCPGMQDVFNSMTDIMRGCLSQYQNYRLERWLHY